MAAPGGLDIEYIDARRVLLDALEAIGPQIGAVTLIGAQAVYLRTVDRLTEYQQYTTDADLVLDPGHSPISRHWAMPAQRRLRPHRRARHLGGSVRSGGSRREGSGEAALLVAKLHKLDNRLTRPDRLHPKDAGDVYRLFDIVEPTEMAERIRLLLADDRSAATAQQAIAYGNVIFDGPNSVRVHLARRALHGTLPPETVATTVTAYWNALRSALR